MTAIRGMNPPPSVERFPLAACRERWTDLLEFEHATLSPVVDFAREGSEFLVWRQAAGGRRISEGRVPRVHRPAIFLQAAAAAAFFAGRGAALTEEDLEQSPWDLAAGTPRLWLVRTPQWVRKGGPSSAVAPVLAAFLRRLFAQGGRVTQPAARSLLEQLEAPGAVLRRGEFWVAGAFRSFPELGGSAAAPARERCLGICGNSCRSLRARALGEKARAILKGREPRIFEPGDSSLTPGGAVGLETSLTSIADASRRLREQACRDSSERRVVWIAVEPDRWDAGSRRAFEAARLWLGDRIDCLTVAEERALAPETPDDWRRTLWVPCGTVAASVRFYEAFAELARPEPTRALRLARGILASDAWAKFVADPTGDAPVPSARSEPGPPDAPSGGGILADPAAAEDPGRRIEILLSAGQLRAALREAERWVLAFPDRRAEAWFPLATRLLAESAGSYIPWLESIEAEKEIAGGRPAEAKDRLARIVRAAESSAEQRRGAELRLAELAVVLGRPAEGARRAAAWRRDHPDAPSSESVRALRLGAFGLAREGRIDCALALLEEADRFGISLPADERIETALARARVYALAGRFEEEAEVYEAIRPLALGAGDDRVAARFLAQEARGLLDRREYPRAVVRLEEALEVARDDPAERAELLLDLATTLYHAGEASRCEALLTESLAASAAAGREDLARIARGNRIELLINRCAWEAAAVEISALEDSARREKDEPRLLVALHHRGRLALRRGFLADAARDASEARLLAARLGDRLEIGELWLEEGDRCVYEGDFAGAERAWAAAAEDPPDRCDSDRIARKRLEELSWRLQSGPPDSARRELAELFATDAYRAAETAARWQCLFEDAGLSPEMRARAGRILRSSGGEGLADRVFGRPATAVAPDLLREIRSAVSDALGGEPPNGNGTLDRLGISGLAVRDADGRELVRLGNGSAPEGQAPWRPLDAGGARFELALWPAAPEEVTASVALLLETLLFRSRPAAASSAFADGWGRLGIVTADASMEEPYRRLARFAPQPVTVLVLGESGSGKEAVARAVHRLSPRSAGPFVPVNVPAIPPALAETELFGHARGAYTGAERDRQGLLEEAASGTIFFDEIGDLAPPLQSKLLRALQEREIRRVGENRSRPIDVRVVSATSRDLTRDVEEGRFREDLYYRLHVALIRLPALRERGRDALLLARHFLERFSREFGRGQLRLAPDTAAAVAAYPWPGNVRELQNAMAQAAALCDAQGSVTPTLLPEPVRGGRERGGRKGGDYRARVDAHRRDLIADALDRAGGNRSRAARDLGLSRQALLYLIRELRVTARPRS